MITRDMMTEKVLSVTADMTLRQIARILVTNGISGVPVVDGEGVPIGMVTESDLIAVDVKGKRKTEREWWLTRLAEGEPLSHEFLAYLDHISERTARDVMVSPVVTVAETAELPEIARLFIGHRVKRLPVVRDGRMVGIVSRIDLVRQMVKEPVQSPPGSLGEEMLSNAIASLDSHFNQSHPLPVPSGKTPRASTSPTSRKRSPASSRNSSSSNRKTPASKPKPSGK